MKGIKNYGKSIKARLLNLAKHEDVFYQTSSIFMILC